MTTGIWTKDTPLSAHAINDMIDSMDAVKNLAIALHQVWCDGYLLIDFTEKTFWGDDIHPLVEQGLVNLGFSRKI